MKDKKVKQVGVSMGIEILGLRDFVDTTSIEKKIKTYIESISPRINMEDLSGWRLTFFISYRHTDLIGVFKKFFRYPSDRQYEISIAIPIPDNTQAPYGMPPSTDEKLPLFFLPIRSDRFHPLDPEYDKYADLDQYIIASVIRAIDLGFTKGFTCYGKKIKFQDL